MFSYQSKCGNLKIAMKDYSRLHNILLDDGAVEIVHSEALRIASDTNDFKLSILFVFELNNPDKIDEIIKRFRVLTNVFG